MRIAICDDSNYDINETLGILDKYFYERHRQHHIDCFQNPRLLLDCLKRHKDNPYDLIILDIVMQQNGIQTAKSIFSIFPKSLIVFQSTSRDFAVEAFRIRAYDYFLKPVEEAHVFDCLDRIHEKPNIDPNLLLEIKDMNLVTVSLNIQDILYIESKDRRLIYHMVNGHNIKSLTLRTKFLDSIPFDYEKYSFLACHSSYIVNLNYVIGISTDAFVMKNEKQIPISKRQYKELKSYYLNYLVGENNA